MTGTSSLLEEKIRDEQAKIDVKIDVQKGNLDLVILRYMARRLDLTLRQLDQDEGQLPAQPLRYQLRERRGRNHSIVIFRQQELFQRRPFAFVGFISKRKRYLQSSMLEEIQQADKKLVEELIHAPGILSYSSLELPYGDWCNLVMLANSSAKTRIKQTETHTHAAYHLANEYYDWIRLHSGTMPEGLDDMEMRLLKTKYYTFYADQPRPSIRELTYAVAR